MNKKLSYLLIAAILVMTIVIPASAQFGIGTSNPDPSAALDIVSTDQGVLHPRLTTAQRDAISSPAEGLTIYNTTAKCLQVWDGTAWNCAVGGNGGGSGAISLPTSIDNSVVQVFAIEDYKRFTWSSATTGGDYRRQPVNFAWLDNDTFAMLSMKYTCTVYPSCSDFYYDHIVTIYNIHFGIIREFIVDTLAGYTSRTGYITKLQNGNLLIVDESWDSTRNAYTTCIGNDTCMVFAIVDQQGNEVTPIQKYNATSAAQSMGLRGVEVLDNGNFIIEAYWSNGGGTPSTAQTYIFSPDGTEIRQNSEPEVATGGDVSVAWGITNFGYITVGNSKQYRAYDFDGNLLGSVTNWVSNTSAFYDIAYNEYAQMVREQDNTMYLMGDAAILQFEAGTTAVTTTVETAFAQPLDESWDSRRHYQVADVTAAGKLLYAADYLTSSSRKVPVGVFTDGTPLLKRDAGYVFIEYDSATQQFTKQKYVTFPPGMRLEEIYTSSDQDNFYDFSDYLYNSWNVPSHMIISPNGDRAIAAVGFDDETMGVLLFDISNSSDITQYTHIALNNGTPQHLGRRFVLTGPEVDVQQITISIEDGYQSGDTITCACTPTTVGSVGFGNTIVLNTASSAAMMDFIIALNELKFSTTAGAGPRTIAVQAKSGSGVDGETLRFTLNVGS